ncbi:hypothetical protein [Brucella pituitosa]|uniref:hypothetical protein n=1 Tax=Brucella pituitosa TaxID=571256 RepID=UPI0018E251F1|nr:hypothetical protein [Brucella pituitosa]
MAVLSDYTSGTITLANGSTAVTGTGTLFQAAQLKEGDTLQIQNLTAVIASVNSNTSLTLTEAWTGTNLTNAPYRARFLPDGSRQTSRATTMIELVGNGVLSNLAELGVETGKVPVGNAAGQYELKDQSTFGIQDPNGTLAKFAALTLNESTQYVQGDGTLQAKTGLPVSTATQTALNGKLNLSGGSLTGSLQVLNGNPFRVIGAASWSNAEDFWSNAVAVARDVNIGAFLSWHERTSQFTELSVNVKGYGTDVYFSFKGNGSFTAPGPINGSAKNFEIDHPADPDFYDLRHCSTEAPEMLVEYRGRAKLQNGRATVNVEDYFSVMPDTFKNLWAEAWVMSLQNQDGFAGLKPRYIDAVTFEIICENLTSEDEVTWLLMARRNDPYVRDIDCTFTDVEGRLIVEFEKPD